MGFRAYLLYVFMVFVRPIEQFAPDLMAYRPILALWVVTFLASVAGAKSRNWGASQRLHNGLLGSLTFAAFLSVWLNSGFDDAMSAFGVISTPVMLFVLTCLNVDTIARFRMLTLVFLLCVTLLSLQGLLAYFHGVSANELFIPQLSSENAVPPKERPAIPSEDLSGTLIWRLRSVGFLNDPNDFAQTIIVVAPWVFMRFSVDAGLFTRLLVAGPWLGMLAYVLSLTHSRGGMLGVAAAVAFFLKDKVGKTMRLLLAGGLVAAFMLGLIGGGDGRGLSGKERSASERIDAWNDGITMLKEHPLLGVGYGNFTEHHIRTAHNSFVLCFAELGVVGYFLWMSLIVLSFQALNRIIQCVSPADDHARYAVLLRISFVGFMVCAWFLSRTFVPTLFILMGMTAGLLHATRQAHPATGNPVLHQPLLWKMPSAKAVVLTLMLVSMFIRFSR